MFIFLSISFDDERRAAESGASAARIESADDAPRNEPLALEHPLRRLTLRKRAIGFASIITELSA